MNNQDSHTNNLADKYFNAAEVMLVVLSADQTVNSINQRGCRILGYKENEIVGKNWFDNFLPERIRKEVKAVFDALIKGKVDLIEHYENSVLTKSGEEKRIVWHNTILKDEKGKVIYTISSGEDVADRKNAEQKLEEFKFISDHATSSNFLVNREAEFFYVNKAACKSLGYSEKELLSLSVPDVDTLYGRSKFQELFNLVQKETIPPIETVNIRKDGSTFPSELTITGYQIDGTPYMFAALIDITERKAAEDELKLRSEITEQVKVSVLTTGLDFKINWVNQAFNALYGYSSDEVIGQTTDFLNIEPLSDDIQSDIYQTMSPEKAWMGEVMNRRKDGTTFLCELDIFPLKDKNGNTFAYAGHQHDITERRQIEEEILSISNIPAENPNPVIRISSDKTILYANDSFNKLLTDAGLSEKDAIKILPDNLYTLIDIALKVGKPHIMIEAKVSDRVISYNIIPIMEQGYVNLYGRDVTERNKFEKELKKKVKDLEKFYEMAVGREVKMKELKQEIKELTVRLSKHEKN